MATVLNTPAQTIEFRVDDSTAEPILKAIRINQADLSWSAVRKLMQQRRILINGALCLDEGRRLTVGEFVQVTAESQPLPPSEDDVIIRYADSEVIVLEKPSGMLTLRRGSEKSWPWKRRMLQPTLDEIVPRKMVHYLQKKDPTRTKITPPKLFPVHRIDRDTSGLLIFARNETAKEFLIKQFADHQAVRKYLAIIPGELPDQTIQTHLIRDRGDGVRGSTQEENTGEIAITHVRTLRKFRDYSELECSLETGRTNQIRIHLAEAGHPVCGDIKYRGPLSKPNIPDESQCPRLALHATQLRIKHPKTDEILKFESAWHEPMPRWIGRLRK